LDNVRTHFDTTPTSKYEVHKGYGQIERREHFVSAADSVTYLK